MRLRVPLLLPCVALLAASPIFTGCGARYYGTMQSSRGAIQRGVLDQLGSARRIGVAPLSFAKVRFRSGAQQLTEDQAFEGKRAAKRASWEEDKKAMVEIFSKALGSGEQPFVLSQVAGVDAASGVDYVVVPEAVMVDPGYFASGLFNADSLLVVHYSVLRASDKQPVFEWNEREESNRGAASGARMRAAALQAGLGAFLTLRAMAKPSDLSAARARGAQ